MSKSHAIGHVCLFRSAYWVGRRVSLYSVKTGWRNDLERSGSLEKNKGTEHPTT